LPPYVIALVVAALIFLLPYRWAWVFPLGSFMFFLGILGLFEFTDLVERQWLAMAKFQLLFFVTIFSARYGLDVAIRKSAGRS
jgi:hypothetical protein